ncbi:MAG TPA: hypothetical protein VL053_16855, partial [Arachidicoccus sp.]|nr:hypothetical protein [Arachidicoccus sp.]
MNTDEKLLQILDNSACLRKGQMIGYLKGNLYPEELRVIELHLSECSLCNDALEGLQAIEQLNSVIDQIAIPDLPHSIAPEKKIVTISDTASKKTEVKINVADRTSSYASQKIPKPRNYSWVGGVGIAALLLLGSALIWQFELKNKTTVPELPDINGGRQISSLLDSVQTKRQDSATHRIAIATAKNGNLKKQDSLSVSFALKQDSSILNGKGITTHEGKALAKKDSGILLMAAKSIANDSEDQSLAMHAKQELKQPEAAKEPTADTKSLKSGSAASKQQEESIPSGEGSDFQTGVRLFKQKKYASALLYLKAAESDKDHPSHWDAVYYSALCNKYLGKTGRAKRLFKRIVNADAPQKSAAKKQLEELA